MYVIHDSEQDAYVKTVYQWLPYDVTKDVNVARHYFSKESADRNAANYNHRAKSKALYTVRLIGPVFTSPSDN